jgi:hypothetical protein
MRYIGLAKRPGIEAPSGLAPDVAPCLRTANIEDGDLTVDGASAMTWKTELGAEQACRRHQFPHLITADWWNAISQRPS